ncbi:MAG: hypothetical protein OXH70_11875 [Acidobacteria bacterium]|nr:hypothetical protein [Acidobacteriota bacterium]
MSIAPLPVVPKPLYNESLRGVYGEFGSGNNLQAIYLQTAVKPQYLDKISLISDIPGSERWSVRDLFQREVDTERVTNSLLPYLESRDKIKFFNPLTLTVLPIDQQTGAVLGQMPRVAESSMEEDGHKWTVRERRRYYRVRWIEGRHEYAQLDWNNEQSRIVAIDGQHRLAALKRMQRRWQKVHGVLSGDLDEALGEKPKVRGSFLDWRIPVVIVTFRATTGRREPPSVLEVVRSIFVYINTEAHKVGEAREILLNDESANALAAQELLERSHSNDLEPRDTRRRGRVPLLFFDWRGQERDREAVPAPAAVKTVGEVHMWFEEYVLGEDFSQDQEMALGVSPGDPLKGAFFARSLDYATSKLVREQMQESVLPAVSHVLETFLPYSEYIAGLRRLEEVYDCGNDLQGYAFDRLRFGNSQEIGGNKEHVDDIERRLHVEIEKLKKACLRSPIDLDVGMRGVMQSFGDLIFEFGYEPEWMEYAMWFTDALNVVYADGWLERGRGKKGGKYLRHVIWDQNDKIVNYRRQHAKNALGAYLSLLIGETVPPRDWCPEWPTVRAGLLDRLESTVIRGYKKEVHAQLKEQFPNGGRELNEAKKKEAEKLAGRQIRRFERALEQFASREDAATGRGGS